MQFKVRVLWAHCQQQNKHQQEERGITAGVNLASLFRVRLTTCSSSQLRCLSVSVERHVKPVPESHRAVPGNVAWLLLRTLYAHWGLECFNFSSKGIQIMVLFTFSISESPLHASFAVVHFSMAPDVFMYAEQVNGTAESASGYCSCASDEEKSREWWMSMTIIVLE